MPSYRIGRAAALVGVSSDTIRWWADGGRLEVSRTGGGQRLVDGASLAELVRALHDGGESSQLSLASARNRLQGIVTNVVRDKVVAQVEVQAGPYRLVSLMTREAADQLGFEPGVAATAVVKATNVVVERSEDDQP
jgi:molybdopterin-binding protein